MYLSSRDGGARSLWFLVLWRGALLAVATLLSIPLPARAARPRAAESAQEDERPAPAVSPDVVSVTPTPREIYVADRDGARAPIPLELGERVLRTLAQGHMGAALTSRRLLLFADGQPTAVEYRWRMSESNHRVSLGARVAVAATSQRVLLLEDTQAELHEVSLSSIESVERLVAYEDMALAVTRGRLLALAAGGSTVIEKDLATGETVTTVNRHAGLITVTTSVEILQYRAGDDGWQVLRTF